MPPVHIYERRAGSAGRVAGSSGGSFASARAHGWPSRHRFARRDGAFALRFGVRVWPRVAFLVAGEQCGSGSLHPAARVSLAAHRAWRFAGELGPNRAVNTDAHRRGFAAAVVAGYLTR